MQLPLLLSALIVLNLGLKSFADELYPSYTILHDPIKALEWSDDQALAYVLTLRLFDYDHHVFQYRRYPCQYFYTDEIQLNHNTEVVHECAYNTTTSDYEYSFQLHLDSRHVEPYILRNIAIQCRYINCSLTLLNMKYIRIGWNLQGRDNNTGCSFDTAQHYAIQDTPYKLTEWIPLRCKSLIACNHSKQNLEQSLSANINIIYGSSYELEMPYCSLEKSVGYVMEKNLAETNRLLGQLVQLLQRGFGKPDERKQARMREYVAQQGEQEGVQQGNDLVSNTTAIGGQVHGAFKERK